MHTPARRKLTYDDFLQFPDDGRRHERIDGAHYVTPSPKLGHQRVSMRLATALDRCLDGIGEVFSAPLDVLLSPHDVVEPYLLVVLRDQAPDLLTEQHVIGPRPSSSRSNRRGRDAEIKASLKTPLIPQLAIDIRVLFAAPGT